MRKTKMTNSQWDQVLTWAIMNGGSEGIKGNALAIMYLDMYFCTEDHTKCRFLDTLENVDEAFGYMREAVKHLMSARERVGRIILTIIDSEKTVDTAEKFSENNA